MNSAPRAWLSRTFDRQVSLDAWPGVLERLRGLPARALDLATEASEDRLGRRPEGRGWSAKEHVGHLADLELLDRIRLGEYLAGAQSLTAADPSNRATELADHNAKPFTSIIDRLRRGRLELVERLQCLSEEEITRTALHPRLGQPMRLIDWAYFVAEHDDHHIASARAALRARASVLLT